MTVIRLSQVENPFPLNECRLSFEGWHQERADEQIGSLEQQFACSCWMEEIVKDPGRFDLEVNCYLVITTSGYPLKLRYDPFTQNFKVRRRAEQRQWTSLRVEDMR